MSKSNSKLNDGCIKIFKLLNLLYKDEAYYENVMNIFKDEIDNNDPQIIKNNQVILNKYLNTLKVFGIKVYKKNNKFNIKNGCYSLDFDDNDIKALMILINAANNIPDENLHSVITEFIETLKFVMDNSSKNKLDSLTNCLDESFQNSDIKTQIGKCKRILEEKNYVEIHYLNGEKQTSCKCTLKDILYDSKSVMLSVYIPNSMENLVIPLQNILSLNVLPQISNAVEMTMTVVYKVKGRLAKTYQPKKYEHTEGYDKYGDLIIINKGEPIDKLLKRLMRYMFNCEIISPKNLRLKMKEMIEKTLKRYEE